MGRTEIIDTVCAFLALPPEAFPSADFVHTDDEHTSAGAWRVVRRAALGDLTGLHKEPIRLRADRDEWRDGVIIEADDVRRAR